MKAFLRSACEQALGEFLLKNQESGFKKPGANLAKCLGLGKKDAIAELNLGVLKLFVLFVPHHKHSFFSIGCGWCEGDVPSEIAPVAPDSLHSELERSSGNVPDIGYLASFFGIDLPNDRGGPFMWMPHQALDKQNTFLPVQESLPVELQIEDAWPNLPPEIQANRSAVAKAAADYATRIIIPYFEIIRSKKLVAPDAR